MVRAKFVCQNVHHLHTSTPGDVCAYISMMPVYNDSPENATWSKYTPGGLIQLIITNPAAIDKFELGKFYYVDFTPA